MAHLKPIFESMPSVLRGRPRWVTWAGHKVPYDPGVINAKANVIDPTTWAMFDRAQAAYAEGGRDGVGFVLNGDGLVGVDLDGCVQNGQPDPAAMALLKRIGCSYIELSPSGSGLRSFGFSRPPQRCKGVLDGVKVELYADARYLTVTGHVLHDGPLGALPGFVEVSATLFPTEEQRKIIEDDCCRPLPSSVELLRSSVGELPDHVYPQTEGQRNECLFELARYLKGTRPQASDEELREIVWHWHQTVLPVIGTKDFAVTWTDFRRGLLKVRHPYGDTLRKALLGADQIPLPAVVAELHYGAAAIKLVRVCMALQAHEGDKPFFISARLAGEMLGIHFTDASKMLAALVFDGVIELVSQGRGRVASRYRMK